MLLPDLRLTAQFMRQLSEQLVSASGYLLRARAARRLSRSASPPDGDFVLIRRRDFVTIATEGVGNNYLVSLVDRQQSRDDDNEERSAKSKGQSNKPKRKLCGQLSRAKSSQANVSLASRARQPLAANGRTNWLPVDAR